MGSRAPRLPAFVPAQRPAWLPDISIPMAPRRFVLRPLLAWGWDEMGAGHHKSTCLCVCVWGGVWVRWGWCKIHVLFFWKPGLGSDKGRRGERIVPPKHLSCLCWGPCPGFRELGHRQPPQIAEALQTYKCGLSGDLEQHNLF